MKLVRPRRKRDNQVIVDSMVHIPIKDFDPDAIAEVKDSLIFDNPAYKAAMQYSSYAYTRIPPTLSYFDSDCGILRVPLGTDLTPLNSPPFVDNRVYCRISQKYNFALKLRDEQEKAVNSFVSKNMDSYNGEFRQNGVVCLPTGKGKSIVALATAHKLRVRTLIIVHKDDLVKSWTEDIEKCFNIPLKEVGIIKAQKNKVGDFFTIATIQTLNRKSDDEIQSLSSMFGMVVTDEGHHCVTPSTLIAKSDGSVVPIKRIKKGDKVVGGEVVNTVKIDSEVYRLVTNYGFLEGSYDHPCFALSKTECWDYHASYPNFEDKEFKVIPLGELDKDYVVPIKIRVPHVTKNFVSSTEASFAAAITCQGHIDKKENCNRVKIQVTKNIEYLRDIFIEFFGKDFRSSVNSRGDYTLWVNDPYVKDSLVNKWDIPVGDKHSKIKIPSFLYNSPKSTIKAYIETCFSCNGTLSKDSSGMRLTFTTSSRDFCLGLQYLLKKFSILCSVQVISRRNDRVEYRMTLGGIFFNRFMDMFNVCPSKRTEFRNSASKNTNRFVGGFYLADVVRVDDLNYKETLYDFEVDNKNHSFIANGIYTHNCPASTYDVINKFAARYKMCLTATPERKDGLSHVINLYFGGFAYKYEATQKEKDILPVEVMQREFYQYVVPLCKKDDRGRWVIKDLRADPVKYVPQNRESFISDIEYNSRPKLPYADFTNLLFYMSYRWACADIVAEYKLGHSCIVFVSQKEQVEALEEYISHLPSINPKDVQTYYGNNSDKVNEEHRKRAEEQRKLITICTYSKATEGTNVQQWECAFLIGTLNDGKNVEQAVGRIRRTKPDGDKLKVARVYDYSYPHTYSIKNHWRTRMQRYLKLGFTIHSYPSNTGDSKPVAAKKKMFTRGYHV